ncbi:Ig-like domain-containing protein [Bradymonas sediminis]|uniref:Uncharacterized protein n=1 Tax=Bradymonas sediminis TaxID=1548548 RepID=A0A2Z4FHQ9_9DELT|nr:Ig-like domain-containing protein [Bradymonas sediminis]AWV88274.1 hypothetical protein DN745_02530 [Bradymonas sediminis]TDP77397.1 alpha-tubulin suppressor-like RCC1 family protein [Bradymonas sediminis]
MNIDCIRVFLFLVFLQVIAVNIACSDSNKTLRDVGDVGHQSDGDQADVTADQDIREDEGRHIAQLVVLPRTIAMAPTGVVQASIKGYDSRGVELELEAGQVVWEVEDPQVATVDQSGKITGLQTGTTQLLASAQEAVDSVEVHVKRVEHIEIIPNGGEVALGTPLQLELRAYSADGARLPVGTQGVWASDPDEIAEVDSNGVLNSQNPGMVEVQVTLGALQAAAEFRVEVKFRSMHCKGTFCCMTSTQSDMYCWGRMGSGSEDNPGMFFMESSITKIETDLEFISYDWEALAGWGALCGLTELGIVYCWGTNFYKMVGREDFLAIYETPQELETEVHFQDIAMGTGAACGLTFEGDLYCWGAKPFYGYSTMGVSPENARAQPYLVVEGPFTEFRMSNGVICLLGLDSRWSCIGDDLFGLIGDDGTGVSQLTAISAPEPLVDVLPPNSPSGAAYCGLNSKRRVYCWGSNLYQTLGHPPAADGSVLITQAPQPTLWDLRFSELRGNSHSSRYCGLNMGVTAIACWGSNFGPGTRGCGLGPRVSSALKSTYIPQYIDGLPEDIVDFSVTDSGGCALTEGGDIWCWGLYGDGSLVREDAFDFCEQSPQRVSTF